MAFIIGISGATGVGKSTLCSDLAERLSELKSPKIETEIRGRVARSLKRSGIPSDGDTREIDYPMYFEKHFKNIVAPTSADVLILDRTIVDTLSYAKVNANLSPQWIGLIESITGYLMTLVIKYFFIPIEFGIAEDGVRCIDPEYRVKVEHAILENLHRFRRDYQVLKGARPERVDQAIRILASLVRNSTSR